MRICQNKDCRFVSLDLSSDEQEEEFAVGLIGTFMVLRLGHVLMMAAHTLHLQIAILAFARCVVWS